MCGILGELRFNAQPPKRESFARMLSSLESRGPDSEGIYHDGSISLGHRRLSIIDLDKRSHQPFYDKKLQLRISYNGEIYNYKELRQELKGLGYNFHTSSDTEVLLKAYHAWQESCLLKLRGMFAFAVWNEKNQSLFLARDPLGIKPLYLRKQNQSIQFSSSLISFLQCPDFKAQLDPVALNYYMSFHSVVAEPRTILDGIEKLPAGSFAKIAKNGKMKVEKYWSVDFKNKLNVSFEEQIELVHDALKTAVKRRLVADVEVGVFLSGGLDSSLVVGLLSEFIDTSKLHTFSIGFENIREDGNEFQYSDLIAKKFSTQHHKIFASSDTMLNQLARCVKSMSEPMTSHDNIGFYLLSKETAKHLKVVQSGQGADEVFAGYHWYPKVHASKHAFPTYRKAFFDRDFSEYAESVCPAYVLEDYASDYVEQYFHKIKTSEPLDKALSLDTHVMLTEDPVKRVDNMTMAFSLEARVPFLDIDLVRLAAKLPASSKLSEDGGKHVLKELGRRIIPREVIDRPKGYFPVPGLKYIQGPYLDFVKEVLSDPRANQRGIFQQSYIDTLLAEPTRHITPLQGSKLWQICLLELWFQQHNINL